MNASGRLNTCKSRGSIADISWLMATGGRVSNAYRPTFYYGIVLGNWQ